MSSISIDLLLRSSYNFFMRILCRLLPIPVLLLLPGGAETDDFEVYPFDGTGEIAPMDFGIMGEGLATVEDLVAFFLRNNPRADEAEVREMASDYIEECVLEGVNWDVAFVQMCLETGFLRFGGLVTEDMNNFCGLGSVSARQTGLRFPDRRTGIAAHVQHLKAYGSTEPLVGVPVDPRFDYVQPRGKAPTVSGLSGTWAADLSYGEKLSVLLDSLYGSIVPRLP